MADERPKKFEEELADLEGVVMQIDSGELSLEDSIDAFERGVGLVRSLNQKLDDVERDHARGSAAYQHVGEAAIRRAHVERGASGRVDMEMIERGDKLVGAAAGILACAANHRDIGVRIDFEVGLDRRPGIYPYPARHDQPLSALAALRQSAPHHLGVKPLPHRTARLRNRRRRRARRRFPWARPRHDRFRP